MRAISEFQKLTAQRVTHATAQFTMACALAVASLAAPRAVADPDRLLDRLEREKRPGVVFDFAGALSAQHRRSIESLLLELEQKTGAQVKVVTLRSLEGGDINDMATRLYERWGIGRRDRDDGVLLLAAMEERRVRIEVGYGLEGVIPDARAGRILDTHVRPHMRAGNPGDALLSGAAALADAVARNAGVTLQGGTGARAPPADRSEGGGTHPLLALLVMIGVIYMAIRHPFLFLLFLGSSRGGRGFGGGGFGGGGFGGFGGGLSGGGGASRGW